MKIREIQHFVEVFLNFLATRRPEESPRGGSGKGRGFSFYSSASSSASAAACACRQARVFTPRAALRALVRSHVSGRSHGARGRAPPFGRVRGQTAAAEMRICLLINNSETRAASVARGGWIDKQMAADQYAHTPTHTRTPRRWARVRSRLKSQTLIDH